MQRKLRVVLFLAGLSTATILILMVIAAMTDSQIWTIVAAGAALVLIISSSVVAIRLLDRSYNKLHHVSSRMKDLENQVSQLGGMQAGTTEQLVGVRRQLKVLRRRVPAQFLNPVESELAVLRQDARSSLRTSFEAAIQLNREPRSVLTTSEARALFLDYLSMDQLLQLAPLITNYDLLQEQSLSTLRRLYRFYKNSGYWDLASIVMEYLYEKSGLENDSHARTRLQNEIAVFSQPQSITAAVDLPIGSAYDPEGPILHMVGRVLPDTQTGYTLRTQYTATAQARKGLPVAIVGQTGISNRDFDTVDHYLFQGIDYYLLPGPTRLNVLLDDWLRHNIEELAGLVSKLRPSVLHAQSDFFNSLVVHAVGKEYGIPTVYESRGFWEDSWLSRTITANQWDDPTSLFDMYGFPSAYKHRKYAEEVARILPDHVFTLAEVMRNHILESAEGAIDPDSVTIVPNAVETANFPMQEPDQQLASDIGLPSDAVTVGYISSMVEYEGIDTLIDAFQLATEQSSKQMSLLLVGDGDYLPQLKRHVEKNAINNVYFTGRVSHEDVLRYYGLIDLFVVPRKPSKVADLVTPLKPFEAFSTGRAVVLSDVGALREIADQSKAVEMFRAGDAHDLANKIAHLVQDPEERRILSERAASWVRNHRTWDGNVAEYFRVYKQLGYKGASTMCLRAELELHKRDLNAGELIDAFALLEVPPLTGWFSNSIMKQTAREILEEGWKYEEFDPVKVDSSPDWASYGNINRSWGFNLHTWKFLEPLLREYSASGDQFWLQKSVDIATDWVATYRQEDAPEDPMLWYDMGLALRVPMLVNLLVHVSKVSTMRSEATVLVDCLIWHVEKLQEDEAFNPNNNHGFYVATAQLHLAKFCSPIPKISTIHAQGMKRLEIMADRQFAQDGVHLEHSPDYHRMLLSSFERAINDGLIDDQKIQKRIRNASRVLGWMIQPDGTLVQFGDTPATQMIIKNAAPIDPETRFIMTAGKEGTAPSTEMAVFREGGYAFVRSPQPVGLSDLSKSGYLALNAAFHSRAHKHADDLTIVWYEKGTEILVDSGRYGYGELLPSDSALRNKGYYYSSTERQYVESTVAHNTLMMDGEDHDRRSRTPYGSGIAECTERDGIFDLSARARHSDYVHRRRVVYTPGKTLLVKDSVFSQSPESREATIWFNIDGNFELLEEHEGLVFQRVLDGQPVRLEIEGPGKPIAPVRGMVDPLRGWRSRQDRSLEPVWSVGFSFPVETRVSVETLLRLS